VATLLYIAEGAFAVNCAGIVLGAFQTKRFALLVPASAYGISSAVSYTLTSWYPLFIGLGIARVLAAYAKGIESEPAHRPSGAGMVLNYAIHIVAGITGAETFQLSALGLSLSALFAAAIQGLDTVVIYRTYSRLLVGDPEARRLLPMKMAQLYPMKVIWYGLVTSVTAAITRGAV
jgi:hypothetical protein